MKNVIMVGGLGNQMFQYAYMMALRNKGFNANIDISLYNLSKMHNGYELSRVFGINENAKNKKGLHIFWLRILDKLKPSLLYTYDKLVFDKNALLLPKLYIYGYWQNEEYFSEIKNKVQEAFSFKNLDETNKELAKKMRLCNSVSLHIRRGDYTSSGMTIINDDYYLKSIRTIQSKVSNAFFYIFSDDINASREMAERFEIRYQIVDFNREMNSYKDMFLMSNCKHNIIANSSFSWWGAWLNRNGDKIVIAPRIWAQNNPLIKPQLYNWILI